MCSQENEKYPVRSWPPATLKDASKKTIGKFGTHVCVGHVTLMLIGSTFLSGISIGVLVID